ncbi:unnamed protein product [Amoebophrya sp. A120]|nr:unnamed protein product [Amoebophrya sp. A120]|eukprot:GSA120T00011920001.1
MIPGFAEDAGALEEVDPGLDTAAVPLIAVPVTENGVANGLAEVETAAIPLPPTVDEGQDVDPGVNAAATTFIPVMVGGAEDVGQHLPDEQTGDPTDTATIQVRSESKTSATETTKDVHGAGGIGNYEETAVPVDSANAYVAAAEGGEAHGVNTPAEGEGPRQTQDQTLPAASEGAHKEDETTVDPKELKKRKKAAAKKKREAERKKQEEIRRQKEAEEATRLILAANLLEIIKETKRKNDEIQTAMDNAMKQKKADFSFEPFVLAESEKAWVAELRHLAEAAKRFHMLDQLSRGKAKMQRSPAGSVASKSPRSATGKQDKDQSEHQQGVLAAAKDDAFKPPSDVSARLKELDQKLGVKDPDAPDKGAEELSAELSTSFQGKLVTIQLEEEERVRKEKEEKERLELEEKQRLEAVLAEDENAGEEGELQTGGLVVVTADDVQKKIPFVAETTEEQAGAHRHPTGSVRSEGKKDTVTSGTSKHDKSTSQSNATSSRSGASTPEELRSPREKEEIAAAVEKIINRVHRRVCEKIEQEIKSVSLISEKITAAASTALKLQQVMDRRKASKMNAADSDNDPAPYSGRADRAPSEKIPTLVGSSAEASSASSQHGSTSQASSFVFGETEARERLKGKMLEHQSSSGASEHEGREDASGSEKSAGSEGEDDDGRELQEVDEELRRYTELAAQNENVATTGNQAQKGATSGPSDEDQSLFHLPSPRSIVLRNDPLHLGNLLRENPAPVFSEASTPQIGMRSPIIPDDLMTAAASEVLRFAGQWTVKKVQENDFLKRKLLHADFVNELGQERRELEKQRKERKRLMNDSDHMANEVAARLLGNNNEDQEVEQAREEQRQALQEKWMRNDSAGAAVENQQDADGAGATTDGGRLPEDGEITSVSQQMNPFSAKARSLSSKYTDKSDEAKQKILDEERELLYVNNSVKMLVAQIIGKAEATVSLKIKVEQKDKRKEWVEQWLERHEQKFAFLREAAKKECQIGGGGGGGNMEREEGEDAGDGVGVHVQQAANAREQDPLLQAKDEERSRHAMADTNKPDPIQKSPNLRTAADLHARQRGGILRNETPFQELVPTRQMVNRLESEVQRYLPIEEKKATQAHLADNFYPRSPSPQAQRLLARRQVKWDEKTGRKVVRNDFSSASPTRKNENLNSSASRRQLPRIPAPESRRTDPAVVEELLLREHPRKNTIIDMSTADSDRALFAGTDNVDFKNVNAYLVEVDNYGGGTDQHVPAGTTNTDQHPFHQQDKFQNRDQFNNTLTQIRQTMEDSEQKQLEKSGLLEYHRILRRKAVGEYSEDDLIHVFARLLHGVLNVAKNVHGDHSSGMNSNSPTAVRSKSLSPTKVRLKPNPYAKTATERRMVQLLSQPAGHHLESNVTSMDHKQLYERKSRVYGDEIVNPFPSPSEHLHGRPPLQSQLTKQQIRLQESAKNRSTSPSKAQSLSPLTKRQQAVKLHQGSSSVSSRRAGGGLGQSSGSSLGSKKMFQKELDFATIDNNNKFDVRNDINFDRNSAGLRTTDRQTENLSDLHRIREGKSLEVDLHSVTTPYVVTFHDLRRCVPRELLEILLRKYDPHHFGGVTCAEFLTMAQLAMKHEET